MATSGTQVDGNQIQFGPNPAPMSECTPGWSEFPLEPLSASQIQEYLTHLQVGSVIEPTRSNLDTLIAAHLERVPFENIGPLLGRPALLHAEEVLHRLLRTGRGGCCFELNSLFGRLLLALGYRLQLRCTRMRLFVPENDPTIITVARHLVLCVQFADDDYNRYLVDVGAGVTAIQRALPLKGDAEPYRLQHLDAPELPGTLQLSIRSKRVGGDSGWKVLYTVDAGFKHWLDFVPLNWFTCTHPESLMRKLLLVGRMLKNGSWVRLVDNRLRQWSRDGFLEADKLLSDEHEVIAVLQKEFGLRLSLEDDVPPLLSRLRCLINSGAQ